MKNHAWYESFVRVLPIGFLLMAPTSAHSQVAVAPGETITFAQADGGAVECRRLAPISCIPLIVTGSTNAADRYVEARSTIPVTGAGVPNYATATVFNDFLVAPANVDRVVDAQIDVTYDYFSSINVAALSKVEGDLSISIVDITWGLPGIPVAAGGLVHQNRTSDQGVTDVSQGTENNNLTLKNAHFQAKLRRGHTYRIGFSLETLGEVSILGVSRIVSSAVWRRLAVTVDEDEVELLNRHDAAIKGAIASHDSDVKALLEEVKRLLNTPTGRRPDFPVTNP